ncbi:uncharacterized protein PHALS_12701 [Plasmopara halstedii]|uniref:Uncharacterized protein n=1 Tax=Plasmopara halstedii TaxID=4781 RepID=A0A0P1AMP4_PLAHL|nr:uncharacterized protein PHALS_12701 [Plasmopara halstedii]CEG42423.1 hypothetical protein PHALS_12701 [Plasmopara halstedii]|eukprot:XP_024578792.1 hypothetical protein PHALS_12701 [Plasmopara halstedii]
MEDDDDSQAQPLPTQQNNVDDMTVDTTSATETEEMEVEDSTTNADIHSLMLISGARVPTILYVLAPVPVIPWFPHPMRALVRQYAWLCYPPVVLEDRLLFSGDRTRPYRLEFRQARLLTNGSDHAVDLPNASLVINLILRLMQYQRAKDNVSTHTKSLLL